MHTGLLATFLMYLDNHAACRPTPVFLYYAFFYCDLFPQWLIAFSDVQFLLFLSSLKIGFRSMEGRVGTCFHCLHYFIRYVLQTSASDLLVYSFLLVPFSVLFRIIYVIYLLFGPPLQVPTFRPSVKDVRFWFDTNFFLDLSYLWSPYKYRRKRNLSRVRR